MRYDELILKVPDDELRVRFHPRMTVLSGLGAPERREFADGVVASLAGGKDETALHYVDGTGRTVILLGQGGTMAARYEDDGTAAPVPIGSVAPTGDALRALALLASDDLGLPARTPREDDPPELQEARATLDEISTELDAAMAVSDRRQQLVEELQQIEAQLRTAADTVARREYAQVLAALEKARAEAAALGTGAAAIENDRRLVSAADNARALAARWTATKEVLEEVRACLGALHPLDDEERLQAAAIPAEVPTELEALVDDLRDAHISRDAVDRRLQDLAVANLPAPSDPAVAELGLLDESQVWSAADRLIASQDELQAIKIDLGGLGDEGPQPESLEVMEETHRVVEEAEQAAEELRLPGVAATGLGAAIALCGAIGAPILMPIGLIGAGAAGFVLLLKPKRRIAEARAEEAKALRVVGAPTYLGFHLRRLDATVDPRVRDRIERANVTHRASVDAWTNLAGDEIDVRHAKALEPEVRAYHAALRSLDGAADEIRSLSRELTEQAEPAYAAARQRVADACAPYLIDPEVLDDEAVIATAVEQQIDRGEQARAQARLAKAEEVERAAAAGLGDVLLQLGFSAGELDARLGAFEWAVADAAEREAARARSRPRPEIDADIQRLDAEAQRLRRPEWGTVSPAEAELPDVADLEAARAQLQSELAVVHPEVDVERLADRRDAVERRVIALEAKNCDLDADAEPGLVAEIQQRLLAHLTRTAQVGPDGDPLPVVLDEVFSRVPADRLWDLLDLLFRVSERQQIVYLTDDAFVAAWARQQAASGTVTVLEAVPEAV